MGTETQNNNITTQKAQDQKQHGLVELDQVNASIAIAKQELYFYDVLNSKKVEISNLVGHYVGV